jgi:hypothetical protein
MVGFCHRVSSAGPLTTGSDRTSLEKDASTFKRWAAYATDGSVRSDLLAMAAQLDEVATGHLGPFDQSAFDAEVDRVQKWGGAHCTDQGSVR